MKRFAFWYHPRFGEYEGRQQDLPFDQHFLKALVAPRPFLSTEALGDIWANPSGTWQTHSAAREVYRFLGEEDRIGVFYREGGHNHGIDDWRVFLDFMEWQLCGREKKSYYNRNPFPEIGPAFDWRAP